MTSQFKKLKELDEQLERELKKHKNEFKLKQGILLVEEELNENRDQIGNIKKEVDELYGKIRKLEDYRKKCEDSAIHARREEASLRKLS